MSSIAYHVRFSSSARCEAPVPRFVRAAAKFNISRGTLSDTVKAHDWDTIVKFMLKHFDLENGLLKDANTGRVYRDFESVKNGGKFIAQQRKNAIDVTIVEEGEDGEVIRSRVYGVLNNKDLEDIKALCTGKCVHVTSAAEREGDAAFFRDISRLQDGHTYYAPIANLESVERSMKNLKAESLNRTRAYEDCVSKYLADLAGSQHPDATIEVVERRIFFLNDEPVVELDAGVLIRHQNGQVDAWLCEHKSCAHVGDLDPLQALCTKFGDLLQRSPDEAPEAHAQFGDVTDIRQSRLFIASDLLHDKVRKRAGLFGVDCLTLSGSKWHMS